MMDKVRHLNSFADLLRWNRANEELEESDDQEIMEETVPSPPRDLSKCFGYKGYWYYPQGKGNYWVCKHNDHIDEDSWHMVGASTVPKEVHDFFKTHHTDQPPVKSADDPVFNPEQQGVKPDGYDKDMDR
jgi:hypothetical protein